jgi:Short C-terminal domain
LQKAKAEDLLEIIRSGIRGSNRGNGTVQVESMSIADEISKLSKLRDQGVITASEFDEMKQQLIRKG